MSIPVVATFTREGDRVNVPQNPRVAQVLEPLVLLLLETISIMKLVVINLTQQFVVMLGSRGGVVRLWGRGSSRVWLLHVSGG